MSRVLLNTLYVQTDGALVRLDYDTLKVEAEGRRLLQVPVQQIGSVVLFGNSHMTASAMHRCVSENREVTFLDYAGRFRCRVVGPTSGNVLLRRAQHQALSDQDHTRDIATSIVRGKIWNSRYTLLRGARDAKDGATVHALRDAASRLRECLAKLDDPLTLDEVRGIEGDAARTYFAVFGSLITAEPREFAFTLRTRRPPRDRMNALLSFVYSLAGNDCSAACETVGLDPQVGYLHCLRSGRPALALDLLEEFRSVIADRLVLSLVNRRQIVASDFRSADGDGSGVWLTDDGRKKVLIAFQQRKREEVAHRYLKAKVPIGLLPSLQAQLLARHLRGDVPVYAAYRWS